MKKIALIVSILWGAPLFCAEAKIAAQETEQKLQPFATNGMLIFLDQTMETGDKIGVFGNLLLTALDQKTCPILASTLLVRDIIKQPSPQAIVDKARAQGEPNAQLYQDLVTYHKEVGEYLKTMPGNPSEEEKRKIIEHIASFPGHKKIKENPTVFNTTLNKPIFWELLRALEAQIRSFTPTANEWIIKKINDHLLLFIPRTYIDKTKEKNNFAKYYNSKDFSENELNLGIKVDKFADVDFDNFINNFTPVSKDHRDPGAFFVDARSSIFIAREDYTKNRKQEKVSSPMPQWFFYLCGHGASNYAIADIEIESFKKLLDFFDSKIVTKLLVYSSCYAAGQNIQKAYKEIKSPWLKTHSFAIAIEAISDAIITHYPMAPAVENFNSIDFEKKKVRNPKRHKFDQFLNTITNETTLNFRLLSEDLFPETAPSEGQINIFNVPQIKLPGVAWFDILDIPRRVVSISETLAASRSADQPLNILQFFSKADPNQPKSSLKTPKQPIAILMYAQTTPFELVIPTNQMPLLVPMIPGNSYQEIAGIKVQTTLTDFFKAMEPLADIQPRKIFLIKKLTVTGVTENGQGETQFENVVVSAHANSLKAFVTSQDEKKFEWNYKTKALQPVADYSAYYQQKEMAQMLKAQQKIEHIAHIRQVQARKIKALKENKEQAQAIAEIRQERQEEIKRLEEKVAQPAPFATNGLLIFIDPIQETGDKIGAVGRDLLNALDQKACPILASTLLLRDIVKQPTPQALVEQAKAKGDPNAQLYQDFVTYHGQANEHLKTIPSNPSEEQKRATVEHISLSPLEQRIRENVSIFTDNKDLLTAVEAQWRSFKPTADEWIIKKVNPHLVLLVPRTYLAEMNRKNNFDHYYSTATFSKNELNLGIKIDQLADLNVDNFVNTYTPVTERDPGAFFVDSLSSIFITQAEYALSAKQKDIKPPMPQWFLYLFGHGASSYSIAGIQIEAFKKLLDFLDAKIVTKLFVYSSCYAAGQNIQEIFKDARFPWLKTQPYVIAMGSLTDAQVSRTFMEPLADISSIDFEKKREKTSMEQRFDKFLEGIADKNTLDVNLLPTYLFPQDRAVAATTFITLLIKFPGMEWFNYVDADRKLVSIGQTLANSRSALQPLDVLKFFSRTSSNPPAGILMYADNVPFELVISTNQMPLLVPMIPGDSYQEIAEIKVQTTLSDFFRAMEPLKLINLAKTFLIKKLTVTGETESGQGETQFENVRMSVKSWAHALEIVVTSKGKQFVWDLETHTLKPTAAYPLRQEQEVSPKRKQAELIEEAQKRKLKALQQNKGPEQAVEELIEERRPEIRRQQAAEEAERRKQQFRELVAQYKSFYGQNIALWVNANNKIAKNKALRSIGNGILEELESLKAGDASREELAKAYEKFTGQLQSFFNRFKEEYDANVRIELEKKLNNFKEQVIDTMPS